MCIRDRCCSYFHPNTDDQKNRDAEVKIMESRIFELERMLEVKEDETKLMNEKINNLETSVIKLEAEVAGIGIVVEKAIENAVVSLVQKLNINQDEKAKRLCPS